MGNKLREANLLQRIEQCIPDYSDIYCPPAVCQAWCPFTFSHNPAGWVYDPHFIDAAAARSETQAGLPHALGLVRVQRRMRTRWVYAQ